MVLTNDQEYTFNVVCVYPTGNSIAVETSATPGLIYPILASTELVVWGAFYLCLITICISWLVK